jgi:NAD(P)-dependent dehydrogenase (short-subunit alcohol dehydrogenase family)
MQVDLTGTLIALHGDDNPVAAALVTALTANGATVGTPAAGVPDMLILSLPLLPSAEVDAEPLIALAETVGEAMAQRGSGRILFLMSAAAGMPMRRHPAFSRRMAGVLTTVRTLAMRHGPHVLVNAVGVGTVGEPLVAGDAAMLGHASVKRPGTIAEVVDTALFFADPLNTYTTGQMLSVDGGWSAGYGRNF